MRDAPDFLSVTKSGRLALSEVKMLTKEAKNGVNVSEGVGQLRNAMKKLVELNLAGDVERAELIIPKGAKLAGDYGIKDGYLITLNDGKSVEIGQGLKNFFIKVIGI